MSKFKFYLKNSFGSLPKINFQFFLFFRSIWLNSFGSLQRLIFNSFFFLGQFDWILWKTFFRNFFIFASKNFNDARLCVQRLEEFVRIGPVGLESQKGYSRPELTHASTLQLRSSIPPRKASGSCSREICYLGKTWGFIQQNRKFHLRV